MVDESGDLEETGRSPTASPKRDLSVGRARYPYRRFWESVSVPEIWVAAANDFADGDRRLVSHGRAEIGVFRWAGAFYAYRNLCPHQGGPACEGLLIPQVEDVLGPELTWDGQRFSSDRINFVCPWHGYEYDLTTGQCVADPKLRIRAYPTVERDGGIYVVVE